MERVSLRSAFHGEPDSAVDGAQTEERGPDQVTLGIKRGKLIMRVPNDVPDDHVITKEYMDQFMQLVLELEDGSELNVTLDSETDLVGTQLIPASERAQASEG